jgi:hypothetical protein
MIISVIGTMIYFAYLVMRKGDRLTSLEGYPRWYQNMVVKEAARLASKDQHRVLLGREASTT